MKLIILFSLVLLTSVAMCELADRLPSDDINYVDPPKAISLQNVDRFSAWAMVVSNTPLVKSIRKPMADLGYYSSELASMTQGDRDTLTQVQLNFSGSIPSNLSDTSVGNATGNFTEVNGSEVYAWW